MSTLESSLRETAEALNRIQSKTWAYNSEDKGTAWHYTTSKAVPGILRAGQLEHPANVTYNAGIWFTLEPYWETQAYVTRQGSPYKALGPVELKRIGIVPFRFGMSTLKLAPMQTASKVRSYEGNREVAKFALSNGILGVLFTFGAMKLIEQVAERMTIDTAYGPTTVDAERKRGWKMHYIHPDLTLPLTEIERIERFDGQNWVDCRERFMNASRILRNTNISSCS